MSKLIVKSCWLSNRLRAKGKSILLKRLLSSNRPIKQFHDIPTTRGGKFLSTLRLILNGGANYLHEHCDKRHKQLGPIYREHLGKIELVFLADTKLVQTVIANEGQYPHHNVPEAWNFYNKLNGIERGLFFQVGEPWAKLRRAFNRVMLAEPRKVARFNGEILKINAELLDSWCPAKSSEFVVAENVKRDLCKWSIETVGLVLFGNRMGCVGEVSSPRAEQLVASVARMFQETSKFQIIPVGLAHKLNLKAWRNFEKASSDMLQLADGYARENMDKIRRDTNSQSLTRDLIELNKLDDEEISRSLVDLIIAAADTTSNSLQWMLYLIGKHPEVQARLLAEARKLFQPETPLEDLNEQAPYLRAFMREVHRLYPTAPFLARTLDKEIQLGPYRVPAGKTFVFSLFTTSRSSNYFNDPLEFKPERWLRKSSEIGDSCPINRGHAFASLPFGIGARMCIGRRAAELQMGLFVLSFVNSFECSLPRESSDVGIKLQMILAPNKTIRLRLRPRM